MRKTPLEEFKMLSAVPRRSYHNEKIVAYCIRRAEELGLFCYHDKENGNVLIRKPAAEGKEEKPGIVLQGHLDMVAQEDPGTEHDWDHEGLELIEEGDRLKAKGTTLGADDGVAPALIFSLLADDTLKNPPLEALLTTDEEVGMDSVKEADLSYLQGKYLINLDGGVEGEFIIGCCGGQLLKACVPEEREAAEGVVYTLSVKGLQGGHSGMEIGTERANAIRLLGRILYRIKGKYEFRITDIRAEGKDNAISKAAEADLLVLSDHEGTDLKQLVREMEKELQLSFRLTEPSLCLEVSETGKSAEKEKRNALSKKAGDALTFLMMHLPCGALNREQSLDGNIETSCNLGLIEKEEGRISIVVSIRSSVAERGKEVAETVASLCEAAGAECVEAGKAYPAWLPDLSSPLIPIFRNLFQSMYGKEPGVGPVHAGLECGYILANSSLEAAIATGPNIYAEHTTQESLSISSLDRTYDFIKAVIETI